MTEVRTISGGPPVPEETLVQTDQVTILGDGSRGRPLRAVVGSAAVVTDGSTILGSGTAGSPLHAGSVPVTTDGSTILGNGTAGSPLHAAAEGGASAAMFFGFTSGTGSAGNDYAATVAVGAPVPFPRDGPIAGSAISRSTASTFLIGATGTYEVSWIVSTSEASQLQVAVNGVGVASTCTLSGAGTQINAGAALISLVAGDLVSIINPPGNATALTIQPADGSLTHAQAARVLVRLIA